MNDVLQMNYRQKKFDRAASSYHKSSGLQKLMAEALLGLLPSELKPKFILELGCGTGHLTGMLIKKFPESQFEISDVSKAMIAQCQDHLPVFGIKGSINWRIIDANMPFPPLQTELLCSNALVQWVDNVSEHLGYCHQVLNTGGHILFSGFAPGNFPELKNVLKILGFPQELNNKGISKNELQRALESSGFEMLGYREKNYPKYYGSALDFLKSLKNIGANGNFGPMVTPKQMKTLLDCYEKLYRFGDGVIVSWKPWFCLAKKLE